MVDNSNSFHKNGTQLPFGVMKDSNDSLRHKDFARVQPRKVSAKVSVDTADRH